MCGTRSQFLGLKMGMIHEMPVNLKHASKIDEKTLRDPFELANAIRENRYVDYKKPSEFPKRPIFGGDRPPTLAETTPYESKKYL